MAIAQATEDEFRESGQPINSELADALRKSRQAAIMTLVENGVIDLATLEERQKAAQLIKTMNPTQSWSKFHISMSPRDALKKISGLFRPK